MSCGRTIDILQVDISFDTEIRVQFVLEADFRVNIYMAAFKRQSPPPHPIPKVRRVPGTVPVNNPSACRRYVQMSSVRCIQVFRTASYILLCKCNCIPR